MSLRGPSQAYARTSRSSQQPATHRPTRASLQRKHNWSPDHLPQDVAQWQAMRLHRMMAPCTATVDVATSSDPAPPAPPAPAAEPDVAACDIRVGRIVAVERHPDADSLYVEQIDVGEAEPRTIVSGLVEFVPLEQMQNRNVLVICNLKPRKMRGIASNGMVLCASNDAHDKVEPLAPPQGATPGERVWFGEGNQTQAAPAEPNRVQKKKIWEGVQPLLRTDAQGVAGFKGRAMLTAAGPVTASSLPNASIA